jgi:ferric-dicitrate binding protein FerR (iron transport regulator)
MSLGSVKELRIDSNTKAPQRRPRRWRLIGLTLAFGVSAVAWLAIFWAVGYYL